MSTDLCTGITGTAVEAGRKPGRKSGTKWNQKMMQVAVIVGAVMSLNSDLIFFLAKPPNHSPFLSSKIDQIRKPHLLDKGGL